MMTEGLDIEWVDEGRLVSTGTIGTFTFRLSQCECGCKMFTVNHEFPSSPLMNSRSMAQAKKACQTRFIEEFQKWLNE